MTAKFVELSNISSICGDKSLSEQTDHSRNISQSKWSKCLKAARTFYVKINILIKMLVVDVGLKGLAFVTLAIAFC